MPYKRKGTTVYKVTPTGLKKKGASSSIEGAKKYLKTLNAIEAGFKPTGRPSKKRR